MTLKEIYNIKQNIAFRNNLNELQEKLSSSGIDTVVINTDRTIRIESSEGIEKITESIDSSVPDWYGAEVPFPVSLIYNLLPLTNNMCLLKL